jgi:4-hydroxy-tetrahydrodipicolinate synthase
VKQIKVDFGSILTAMVTPFDHQQRVNYSVARRLALHLIKTGSDGLVLAGTTGESPVLSKEEKIELFRVVAEEVNGQAAVIANTGTNNTADSIHLTKAAQEAGVDGVMVVAPYYSKPSQEGLYRHFKAIAQSTRLPVILYNIPGRTGVNILPETIARLAKIDNITALKEAAGNPDQVSELKILLPAGFTLYSGDDSFTLPMLSLGAKGVISVASHLVGLRLKEMVAAVAAGNINRATQIHLELFPLFKSLFITTNPIPIKAALNLTGWNVGAPRLPLVEASQEEKEKIKGVLTALRIIS